MRPALILPCLLAVAACGENPVQLFNPFTGDAITINPQGYSERRGMVELEVKDRFGEVLANIETGGGPALTRALDAAAVPSDERPARILQLQGDIEVYRGNPDALITQLLLFGA